MGGEVYSQRKENNLTKNKTKKKSQQDILAIELTDRCIQAITGQSHKNNITIYDAFRVPVPLGCVTDGEISDLERLASIISAEVMKRSNFRNLAFVTDAATVVKRRFLVPSNNNDADLANIVAFKLGEYLGIDMDNYVVNFEKTGLTGQGANANEQDVEVYACALPKKSTDLFFHLTENLGVEPHLLNVSTNVLQKLIAGGVTINNNLNLSGFERVAFLEICDRSIRINIYENGQFFYCGTIPMGMADIIDEISISLRVEFKEASSILFNLLRGVDNIFTTNFSAGGFTPVQLQVVEIINNQIFHWLDEVKRVFLLYSGSARNKDIQQIFMHGVGCDFKGLDGVFSGELGRSVVTIRSLSNINNPSNNAELNSFLYRYVNLIGLIS